MSGVKANIFKIWTRDGQQYYTSTCSALPTFGDRLRRNEWIRTTDKSEAGYVYVRSSEIVRFQFSHEGKV